MAVSSPLLRRESRQEPPLLLAFAGSLLICFVLALLTTLLLSLRPELPKLRMRDPTTARSPRRIFSTGRLMLVGRVLKLQCKLVGLLHQRLAAKMRYLSDRRRRSPVDPPHCRQCSLRARRRRSSLCWRFRSRVPCILVEMPAWRGSQGSCHLLALLSRHRPPMR